VIGFESATELAGAYGVAVTTTMVITTVLAAVCARRRWGWHLVWLVPLIGAFLVVDLAFFGANMTKIVQGGWVPLLVAGTCFLLMTTWAEGVGLMADFEQRGLITIDYFLKDLDAHPVQRVPGTAVVMSALPLGISRTLLHNIKHNKVLHERVIQLTVLTEEVPTVDPGERIEIDRYRPDFIRVNARFGFMETPNVPRVLELVRARGVPCDPASTTYFLGRETVVIGSSETMSRWRKHLFAVMLRNAYRAHLHFGIPNNRVIEIGAQVSL
jgi:KUP system potassium uptake protein